MNEVEAALSANCFQYGIQVGVKLLGQPFDEGPSMTCQQMGYQNSSNGLAWFAENAARD